MAKEVMVLQEEKAGLQSKLSSLREQLRFVNTPLLPS